MNHRSLLMQKEIAKIYDPKQVENKWYAFWLKQKYFHADAKSGKKPYTIVIPPPNVTARLHMGHAFNNTLQDILIRFIKREATKRCGFRVQTTPESLPRRLSKGIWRRKRKPATIWDGKNL